MFPLLKGVLRNRFGSSLKKTTTQNTESGLGEEPVWQTARHELSKNRMEAD